MYGQSISSPFRKLLEMPTAQEFHAMWENCQIAQGGGVVAPKVVVNLPHRDTPQLVESVIPLWLNQSVPVAVDVVDTGSGLPNIYRLNAFSARYVCGRGRDIRFHTIAPRPWKHPSEPIAMACELSMVYAETDYILFSHVDVFPHSRHLVRWLMDQCSAETPVVGYEISPRDGVDGWLSTHWKGMVGHSLTMVHVPTLRSHGIHWRYDETELIYRFNWPENTLSSWDTEVTFNMSLKRSGLPVKIVGHDKNMEHLVDEWHGHARSYPGSLLFGHPHLADAACWVSKEMEAARLRVAEWTNLKH